MRRRFMNSPNTPININDYLTIEALEDGLYVYLSVNSCEYCIDGDGNWKSLPADTATNSFKKGQTLSFRGNLTPNSDVGIGRFTISKSCNLKGNVMSMLFGDKAKDNYNLYGYNYAFSGLFYYCTTIKTVSNNFLPATTLASYCYKDMFSHCTSLTTAPELPATILAHSCYSYMFSGCTKLNYIKMLATHILTNDCLDSWVNGVASTGTFVKNPEATWEVYGSDGIPNGWTVEFDGEEDEGTYDEVFGEIPPESTEFGWPLYITVPHFDTKENFRSYYKQPSDIGLQLYNWIMENYEEEQDPWGGGYCTSYPPELYINGEKIEYCYWDVFFGQVQNYPTFNTTKISDGTVTEEGAIFINVFIG